MARPVYISTSLVPRRSGRALGTIMRIYNLIAVALLALTRTAGAESTNWPSAAYTEVRAYLYNLEGEGAAPILKQGKLNATVWNPEGVALSKTQIYTAS